MPPNAWREAQIALAGPLVGSAGAVGVWVYGEATDSRAVKALAFLGFLINLFNLSDTAARRRPRSRRSPPLAWFVGRLTGRPRDLAPQSTLILIVIIAAFELWNRWEDAPLRGITELLQGDPVAARAVAVVYFGLAILLVLGMQATHVPRDF